MAIKFQGSLVCSLNVASLERSVRWYKDAFGLEEIVSLPEYGWCQLSSPVAKVSIGLQEAAEGYGQGGATLSFTVDDIESARNHLVAMGAAMDGDIVVIPGDDGVKLANFFDPDGNPLTLAEPNQTAP